MYLQACFHQKNTPVSHFFNSRQRRQKYFAKLRLYHICKVPFKKYMTEDIYYQTCQHLSSA